MSTFEEQAAVRAAVKVYLAKWGYTSLRKIAAYVKGYLDLKRPPAATTIARIVKQLGKQ